MLRLLTFCFMLFLSTQALAQNTVLNGKVNDATGNPISGASVRVVGSNKGTLTNDKGEFTLTIAANASLQVSSTNFETKVVAVQGKSTLSIVLAQEATNLSEVVIIGYGSQKKKDLTGAVRKINLEGSPLSTITNVNALSALQGTPGVNVGAVATAGGSPSILVRGQRSLSASNAPLVILDGVIFSGNLNEINTQDIASFDVLMDASAAAIYGSRAANGVIIVTTKVGKAGKPTITFTNNYGVQSWTRKPEMRMGQDFIKWRTDNRRLAGQADLSVQKVLDPKELIAYNAGQQINWLDEITQFAPLNDVNKYTNTQKAASNKMDTYNFVFDSPIFGFNG